MSPSYSERADKRCPPDATSKLAAPRVALYLAIVSLEVECDEFLADSSLRFMSYNFRVSVDFEPDSENDLRLAICMAKGAGGASFRKICDRISSLGLKPNQVFEMSAEALCNDVGLPREAAEQFVRRTDLAKTVSDYKEKVGTKDVRMLTSDNVLFPDRILQFMSSPPGFVFAYGNIRALSSKTFTVVCSRNPSAANLEQVERAAEEGVLASKVLVGGTNTDAYQRAAVVPLRWGAPRILVLDRGLFIALGDNLDEEPFRTARLWRYKFDPETDLVLSRSRPFDEYAPANQKYRDELIFALSDEVRAIAIRPGGNMDKLATRAEAAGRTVVRN